MSSKVEILGRCINKRKTKTLVFLDILTPENEIIQIVVKDEKLKEVCRNIGKGIVIKVAGTLEKSKLSKKYEYDLYPSDITIISRNYHQDCIPFITPPKKWSFEDHFKFLVSEKAKSLLLLRHYALNVFREYLNRRGLMEVHSPKIVGSIVAGPTNSFEVTFYGSKCYLSISNVLYHHILMIAGYNKIYEISPIFRQQPYGTKYQLSEFWVLDISEAWKNRNAMMKTLESLLQDVYAKIRDNFEHKLKKVGVELPKVPEEFEVIEYKEVMNWLGIKEKEFGTHLPHRLIKELRKRNIKVAWVINAPSSKKPFFIKRKGEYALSAELWTDRVPILASGGERVTDYREAVENLKELGYEEKDFESYLNILKYGAPPSYTIGMGVERFIQYLTLQPLYYIIPFPRFPFMKIIL